MSSALVRDIFGDSDSDDDDDGPTLSRLKRGSDAPAPVAPPPPEPETTETTEKKKKKKKKRKAPSDENEEDKDEGGAYESDGEPEETEEDRAFIDTENDDEDLLREYAADKQDFSDDRRDAGFEEEPGLGTARDENDEKKKKAAEDDASNPLTKAMLSMKKTKQKEMTQDEKDKVCMALLGRMNDAYLDDVDARSEGRPASQKMGLLPVVKKIFNQRTLQNTLLEFDALVAVCDWLRPLADGSLPSLAIRTAMLEVMQPLPAQPDHLKKLTESGTNVGRVVMKYSRDPRETPENRRLARQLVEQWSRPVVGRGVSYKNLAAQQEEEFGQHAVQGSLPKLDPNRDDADELIKSVTTQEHKDSSRVKVPQFNGFDFVVRPANNTLDSGRASRSTSAAKSLKYNPESSKGRIAKRVKKSSPGRR